MVIRLVGAARLVDGSFDVRVEPGARRPQHPLAAVDGAFNAVMLQGDAIREITLEGPGAGGIETASAVIADMVSVIGTMGTGFLQNDAAWRELPRLPSGESRSPFYFRLSVDDRPGVLARVADELAERDVSVARLLQHPNGNGAALHVVTHEARDGRAGRRARGDRRAARGAQALAAAARDLGSRCLGARMGVIDRRDACRSADSSRSARARPRSSLPGASRSETRLDLHLKFEGANPTGSFKDRGMVVAVANAVEAGARARRLRVDREHRRVRRRVRRAGGADAVVLTPAGAIGDREARAVASLSARG